MEGGGPAGLGLALGSPIFPSGCEGKLGVALEPLGHSVGSKKYPVRLERRAESLASPRAPPRARPPRPQGGRATTPPRGL